MVSKRSFRALRLSKVGSNVSGMVKRPTTPKKKVIITVMNSIQRQPKCDIVIHPPTMGPATGLMKVDALHMATAILRLTESNRSARITPNIEPVSLYIYTRETEINV